MRDTSYAVWRIVPELAGPFVHAQQMRPPWLWIVTDGQGREVATARTRAGARAAVLALYGQLSQAA